MTGDPDEGESGSPTGPKLTSMTLGTLTLSPAFDPDVTEYTADTTNATNKLTVAAEDGAEITVTLGETAQNEGLDDKYTLTWETGVNTVTVNVSDGTNDTDYTITVTKA